MKKLLAIAAASIAAGAFSTAANAAVLDFAAFAAGNEHGIDNGDSLTFDGVSVTFVANDGFHPYFDDEISGRPSGLGVCRELTGSLQCKDSSDDSADGDLGTDEFIKILFDDGPFDVRNISFRDGEHFDLNGDDTGMVTWSTFDDMGGLVASGDDTFADVVAMALSGFFDGVDGIGFEYVDTEFYVEAISDVPLPAALPLLLSGIAGLGFASRRKKKVV